MTERDPDDFREPHLRPGDFLGAFGVIRQERKILMVENRRTIGGVPTRTWDLPGGQVAQGELLGEALRRELHEEVGIEVVGSTPFLFMQEGEKRHAGQRRYAWRSFFFAVHHWHGTPVAGEGVEAARWFTVTELRSVLQAPYHDSFLRWLREGGTVFHSIWDDES